MNKGPRLSGQEEATFLSHACLAYPNSGCKVVLKQSFQDG